MMQQNDTQVINFWFRELTPVQWFQGGAVLDTLIQEQFGVLVEAAMQGECDNWAETPRGRLALIIVLDQFTRNIFRGSPKSYQCDPKVQQLTLDGIERGDDKKLIGSERQFFYMPLMHAEDKALQELSVEKFTELKVQAENTLHFANAHLADVARFGHFPHRNSIVGRESTEEELAYLASDDTWFS